MVKKKVKTGSVPVPVFDSAEPYFYVGLVLKGTEKQYVNLLKYVSSRNGCRLVYQCKSLTYLRVSRADPSGLEVAACRDGLVSQEAP